MERRSFIKKLLWGTVGGAAGFGGLELSLDSIIADTYDSAVRGLPALTITGVRSIASYPGFPVLVVKVTTNEPGLYGLGAACYTQRPLTVKAEIDEYLTRFAVGRSAENIEDMWQSYFVSSYFRNGAVTSAALSGLDMALWDIMGKRAGMPLYKLLGGRCRFAVQCYKAVTGRNFEELKDKVYSVLDEGFRVVKIQLADEAGEYFPGRNAKFGSKSDRYHEVIPYVKKLPGIFEELRAEFGYDIGFLHDHVGNRVPPIDALQLIKELERYKPYFLEDPFTPEDLNYLRILRQQSACPIAMGENFTNPHEWEGLISERLIDFIRCHMSTIGGITPALKLTAFSEYYNVRTAWHGPANVTPVGDAANAHLDLSAWNFGIQEFWNRNDDAREMFPGSPVFKKDEKGYGYMHVSEDPGLGVDVDEEMAAKFPFPAGGPYDIHPRTERRSDGTIIHR